MNGNEKLIIVLAILFGGLILAGCGDSKDSISDAEIKEIHKATEEGNLEKVKSMICFLNYI